MLVAKRRHAKISVVVAKSQIGWVLASNFKGLFIDVEEMRICLLFLVAFF